MYQSERIGDHSYPELQDLHHRSFGSNQSVESFQHRYDTQVFGLRNVGMIARHEHGESAAYYGVFPIRLTFDGDDYLVAQSGDTMTAPNHRKKGLFTRLAKETYDLCVQEKVQMVFGFPNANSLPGFARKLDWVFTGAMQRFTVRAAALPWCELASKYPQFAHRYVKYAARKVRRYKIQLNEENIRGFDHALVKGQIKKDLDFFAYKLRNPQVALVEVDGIRMLVKADAHLRIGAVAYQDGLQPERILHAGQKLARRLGCGKMLYTLSPNHWLYALLKASITPTESLQIGFYEINKAITPADIQFCEADYDTF